LVPAVTAVMDFAIFGNRLAPLSLLGMGLIVVGLLFVFRKPALRAAEA
jgi:drug/metabolite transporter (DMT)-like permease